MYNQARDFTVNFHSGAHWLTQAEARIFEDRYYVNLLSSKADDPAVDWKCSTIESEEDSLRWFWISTTTHTFNVHVSLANDLPSGEVVVMPRLLNREALEQFATSKSRDYPDHDISKFAPYEDLLLELVACGPCQALWQYNVPDTEIKLELQVRWNQLFDKPEFDLQVYGAPDEVDLLSEMSPRGDTIAFLKTVVSVGPEEPPFGYKVFNYQGGHYILVQFGEDHIVFTRGFMLGLQEVPYGSDAHDEIEHIYDELIERPLLPFPILR